MGSATIGVVVLGVGISSLVDDEVVLQDEGVVVKYGRPDDVVEPTQGEPYGLVWLLVVLTQLVVVTECV